jgi:N-acetylglutamate synthase-like GNAT family acetyltransferase
MILKRVPEDQHDITVINLNPVTIADYGVCGYNDIKKHVELRRKIRWFAEYYPKGVRIKALVIETGGYQGMIEYIPGRYAHRPVEADDYLFIHCIFVGFKKEYKGRGFASLLIDECCKEAKKAGMHGVAVVTRKGSFMAKKDIFVKKGFVVVDTAAPDFDLLALKFDQYAPDPKFRDMHKALKRYAQGLVILRSPQCPYTEKNVMGIIESAQTTFNLDAALVELDDARAVQESPCPFGTFCIIHDGEIISHHPISKTRFENIMKTRTPQRR